MSVRAGSVVLKVLVSGDACLVFLEAKSFSYSMDRNPHLLSVLSSHSNLEDFCRKDNAASI